MSTSVKQALRRQVRTYWSIAVFCGIFSFVYERFSHGVYSNYMIFLFLIPLLGGVLPLALSMGREPRPPVPLSRQLWGAGIATLSVGCCLDGVFEIYGTTAPLVTVYWAAGLALVALAAVCCLLGRRQTA